MKTIIFVMLLFISGFAQKGHACSLAIHDWKLVFFAKIPISAPFFPLAEINFLNANFKKKPSDNIFWLAEHSWLGQFLFGFAKALPGWPPQAAWRLLDKSRSVLQLARDNAKNSEPPIIIGSDKNFLKVAFFSDANSGFKCHQIVIMQNSRIRGVLTRKDQPWAQELNGMSWVSMIFFQLPYPGRILSLSVFPHNYTRISIFEDHAYVEGLLAQKLLKRRPDLEIDPFVFDFPELPD